MDPRPPRKPLSKPTLRARRVRTYLVKTETPPEGLHDNNLLLEKMFASEQVMVAYMDTHFRFLRVSKAYAADDGREPEFYVGKNHFDLYPSAENEAIFHRAVATGEPHFAYAKPFLFSDRPDRGTTYWDWSLLPIKESDAKVTALVLLLVNVTERRRTEEALRETQDRFRMVAESMADGLITIDERGVIESFNPAASRIFGYTSEEIVGQNIQSLMSAELRESHTRELTTTEMHGLRKDGTQFPLELGINEMRLGDRRLLVGIVRDISARRRADEEMRKLSSAIQQTADLVIITDRNGMIEYVNQAFESTTGYTRDEVIGKNPSVVKSGMHEREFYKNLWRTILRGEVFRDVLMNRRKNGELYYEEKAITPLKDAGGTVTHFISTGKDITERMQVQEKLQFLAHHDVLTNLPNRVLFMDRLTQSLLRAQWRERVIGVLFLDLDRFKHVNDTLGHSVGDQFLQAIAARLNGCVRERDTIARIGGDEFAVLLDDIGQPEDVSIIAKKILASFTLPFMLENREVYTGVSIGISIYPGDGHDASHLLANADAAMYRAKELGRNNYQFYSADMSTVGFERLTLEASLRHALERREFVVFYQPQVNLTSGKIVGMEALLRWQHPDFGLIGPQHFLTLAEETGLIVPIGDWVARTAFSQARAWQDMGLPPLRMAVNLSNRQFSNPDFIDSVGRWAKETSLGPAYMELEFTEGIIMKDVRSTISKLRVLRAIGVSFAIDDFGTGYSSLSYLRSLPLNTLKIDKSFISDVTTDQDGAAIVKTIIAMAHSLKFRVVAEGVETQAELDFLRANGCDGIQGYLFSRPLPVAEITKLLQSGKHL